MSTTRAQKVEERLRAIISEVALQEVKDPRMGFLTITGVEVTADLRFAKVYVSVFGQDRDKKRSLAALESAKGFIRRRVGEEGNLRFVPELAFAIDETAEETQKVTGILQRLRQEQDKERGAS